MNYFAKQRVYNEIQTNSSQMTAHQKVFNSCLQAKLLQTYNKDKCLYKSNNYSDVVSQDIASTQINSQLYYTHNQALNNINTNEYSQKNNLYQPQQKFQENYHPEQNKLSEESYYNKGKKVQNNQNQINENKQRTNSFSHSTNSDSQQNNQINVKYFKQLVDSQKNQEESNSDYKLLDQNYSNNQQNEQIFLSDRKILLPSIITPKKSSFINAKPENHINFQENFSESKVSTQESNSITKSQKVQKDENKSINQKSQIDVQEYLKDWLIGKTNQSYLLQSINQVRHSPQKDSLPFAQQISSPNKKLQNIPESKKRFSSIDNNITKENSKEINTSLNCLDGFDSQNQSSESIKSSQSINQQPTTVQNQYTNQPSIFKLSSIQPQQAIENQFKNNTDKIQNQQPQSQSQTILKQILQSSSNSSLINIQPPDLIQLKKKGFQKSRRNKLQSWMNEVNNKIENSLVVDSQENSQNSEYVNLKKLDSQNPEMIRSFVQTNNLPQLSEEQTTMTKSCFFLPKISQRGDHDLFAKRPSLKKNIMIDSQELKNQTQSVTNPQDNLQKQPNFPQNNEIIEISQKESIQLNQISKPAKNKINSGSNIRQRNNSEPILSRNEINKLEDMNYLNTVNDFNQTNITNPINDFQAGIQQKLGKPRASFNNVINYQKADSTNNNQIINQQKPTILTESINSHKCSNENKVKSILRNKSETRLSSNKQSLVMLESTTDTETDDYLLRRSYASTRIGNSQSTLGGLSFQKEISKSILFDESTSPKNQKVFKRVNFNERIDIYDIKEIEQTLKPKRKSRTLNQSDSSNFKQ